MTIDTHDRPFREFDKYIVDIMQELLNWWPKEKLIEFINKAVEDRDGIPF